MTQMEENIDRVSANFLLHIQGIVLTVPGKVIATLSFIAAYFAESYVLFITLFGMIVLDMLLGIAVSIKKKGKGSIESGRIKDTGLKLLFNMLLMMLSYVIEKCVSEHIETSDIGTTVVFTILATSEVISILSNMTILAPHMVALKFFHLLFRNEIAKKLGIDNEEVDKILKDNKRHRKQRAADTEKEIENVEKLKEQ